MITSLANLHRHTTARRSFVFFTPIPGLVIALFITFACMNYSSSPSTYLVSAAGAVIDGAPAGKLIVYTEEPQSTTPPTPIGSSCVREAADESAITVKWDSNFRVVYTMLALLSSIVWYLVNATRTNMFKGVKPPTR